MREGTAQTRTTVCRATPELHKLISGIKKSDFQSRLLTLLNDVCGADHCGIYRLDTEAPCRISVSSVNASDVSRPSRLYFEEGYWRRDPMVTMAHQRMNRADPSIIQVDVQKLSDTTLRDLLWKGAGIRERLMICGGSAQSSYGIVLLRSDTHPAIDHQDIDHLKDLADPLLSAVAAHHDASDTDQDLMEALVSVKEIERRLIGVSARLPKREAEVCARMLLRQSRMETSTALGITEATVQTYRKRVFQRLEVSSQRELAAWYLNLCKGGVTQQ